jgi:chemotaxis protein MotA
VNLPSILIVIGGTFLVVMIKFSLKDFLGAFKVATRAFKTRLESPAELIEQILEISRISRKEGVLALERVEISNQFLADAVMMLVDGIDKETIKARMGKDLQQTISRHSWGAKVFIATADVAPAMGMIGTLIGLVQMLSNMEDPKSIGPAMAVALLTTLYGAVIANMIAKPIADKLTLRKMEEGRCKALCLDGVLAIQDGLNPRLIEPMLSVYLAPNERKADGDEASSAATGKPASST